MFSRLNIFETDTETFFETKIFETETDTLKKLRKVSIPRSLETRCHTLLTSNQSHPKSQRGANEETSSQYEVWGPTDGSRLVAWEELTLLPAFLPNHRSSSRAAQQNGRQGRKKRETRLPSSHCCLCWKISDYIWGRRRTWTRRAIHGSCGIRFWGSCLGNVADASPWDLLASLLDNKSDLTILCF